MEGPSHFSFCKMQLFKQHFKKSLLRCEVSITGTEVSGWLLNSLKLLFSAMQMILFSAVQADTDDDGCFEDQHLLPSQPAWPEKREHLLRRYSVGAYRVNSPVLWEVNL